MKFLGQKATYFSNERSNILKSPLGIVLVLLAVVGIVYLLLSPFWEVVLPSAFGIPVLLFFFARNKKNPSTTLKVILVAAFLINGLTRLLPIPLGLGIDILILIAWLTIFFKSYKGADWSPIRNLFVYCLAIWALYCVLQLANPQAKSLLAWFYASRGLAFYSALLLPVIFLIFNTRSDMKWFINCWFIFSILLGLYGAKQYWIGLFPFEQTWLNHHGYLTHILWGKFTRMFSFASDANQFGICQAHCAIVATIFAFSEKSKKRKFFYVITALISYYGMIISGTRGAMIVPGVGALLYLLLSRNRKIIITGAILSAGIYVFLAHTFILNDIGAVSRMRSVFNSSQDQSYIVRMENRALLDVYMRDKPFGGGIGSAGNWGNRFSPNTFLAEFETDGMYVRIYAETGIVGFYLYILLYGIIILKMIAISWKLKDPRLRVIAGGLTCGVVGIMASNYGADNSVGLPTSIVLMWSLAIVYMTQKWDKGEEYPIFGAQKSDQSVIPN